MCERVSVAVVPFSWYANIVPVSAVRLVRLPPRALSLLLALHKEETTTTATSSRSPREHTEI